MFQNQICQMGLESCSELIRGLLVRIMQTKEFSIEIVSLTVGGVSLCTQLGPYCVLYSWESRVEPLGGTIQHVLIAVESSSRGW